MTRRIDASRRRGLTPFVGRDGPIARLREALDEAATGRLRRVNLVGDAGLGKTRLVEEFLARERAAGTRILTAWCEREGTTAPLSPFAQLVREALDLGSDPANEIEPSSVEALLEEYGLADHATELLGLLGRAGHSAAPPKGGAAALLAFGALVARLAQDDPLVVFVDDWQWSDDASRVADGELARGLGGHKILWIIAARPTHTTARLHDDEIQIELAPFDTQDTAAALTAIADRGLDLRVAERLHRRSGGNPLYLEELFRSLDALDADERDALEVPPTLHGLLEHRVHALPPDEAAVLRAAAVIGNVVPTWLLEEVTELDDPRHLLGALAEKNLLHASGAPGTLRFQHGITRDVVYHAVKLSDRRKLHTEIAAHLERRYAGRESERPLEALAHHYEGAANFTAAADNAEAAGDRAWGSSALDRARDQYGAALAALDQLDDDESTARRWLEISKRRAFACVFQPAPEQIEMLNRAAEIGARLDDTSAVGHAHFWAGFISYSLGEFEDATAQYTRGLEVAKEAGDERLFAQVRANLGQNHAAACQYDAALALLDESLESKRRLQSKASGRKPPTGLAYALAVRGLIDAERGNRDEGDEWIELSLAAVEGTGHPVAGSCLAIKSATTVLYGRFHETLALAPRVQALGQRMNGPFLFGRGQADTGFARFMTSGDLDALDSLTQAADWLEERGIRLYQSLADGTAAEALVRAGRVDRARRHAERALSRADRLDRLGEGFACRALARIEARESPNRPDRAQKWLERARTAARARDSERELLLSDATAAELLAQAGERDAARDAFAGVLPRLERMGLEWHTADARRRLESLAAR